MPYITEEDIERELSYSFGDTTQPTATEIAEFIKQVEAELDGILSAAGATVPISDTDSPGTYAMVQQAAIWGVCARTIGAFAGLVAGESPKETLYWERYRNFCDRVTQNPAILYDAAFSSTRVGGITETADDHHDPHFTMVDKF